MNRLASTDAPRANHNALNQNRKDILNGENGRLRSELVALSVEKQRVEVLLRNLTEHNQQLQQSYESLTAERDKLVARLQTQRSPDAKRLLCPTHWRVFEAKCYFVSTAKKNWTESRRACIAEGADLLIINRKSVLEILFSPGSFEQNAWIGLTDSLTEGVWTWVDGTPVTTTYWGTGQPNSHGGDQDCGELVQSELNGGWNDDGCFAQQLWICEK
uniref:C-type lectin domain family 4 member M-like n=1 Tax=Fundulus heteroclitus TaxID=8078 RepID=A0A3Q2QUX1_FUNHE